MGVIVPYTPRFREPEPMPQPVPISAAERFAERCGLGGGGSLGDRNRMERMMAAVRNIEPTPITTNQHQPRMLTDPTYWRCRAYMEGVEWDEGEPA